MLLSHHFFLEENKHQLFIPAHTRPLYVNSHVICILRCVSLDGDHFSDTQHHFKTKSYECGHSLINQALLLVQKSWNFLDFCVPPPPPLSFDDADRDVICSQCTVPDDRMSCFTSFDPVRLVWITSLRKGSIPKSMSFFIKQQELRLL